MTRPWQQSFLVNNFIWVYSQGTVQMILCTSSFWCSWAWQSSSVPRVRAVLYTLQDAGLCAPLQSTPSAVDDSFLPEAGWSLTLFFLLIDSLLICQVSFLETLGHKGLFSSWPWQGFSETVEQTTKRCWGIASGAVKNRDEFLSHLDAPKTGKRLASGPRLQD